MKEALKINHATNTDFWWMAINEEMLKVNIAWTVCEGHTLQDVDGGKVPEFVGFQEIGWLPHGF